MKFEKINPYLRFVRRLEFDKKSARPLNRPYDARFFYTKSSFAKILADGVEYDMPRGSMLFIPSGTEYQLIAPPDYVCYIAINFDFTNKQKSNSTPIPPETLDLFNENEIIETVCFSDIVSFNSVLHLNDMVSIETMLSEIEREYSRKLVLYESKISNIFTQILIKCARSSSTHALLDVTETAERILNYIHINYNQSLTNADIANAFGFHPNYISSIIKNCTGVPLHKYLINIRLEHALRLLEEGTLSIGEIATECGFCDIYYFSKYFKNNFGKSPRSYRKK